MPNFWLKADLCIEASTEQQAKELLDQALSEWARKSMQADSGLVMFDRTGLAEEEDK